MSYPQFLQKVDMPCPIDNVHELELGVITKKYHYSHIDNIHYITKHKLLNHNGEELIIQSFYNISEEFAEIKSLEDKLHTNRTIIKCANTLLEDTGAFSNTKSLLKIVCEYYKSIRANLFLFDNENDTIKCMYDYCMEDVVTVIDDIKDVPIPAKVWRELVKDNNFYSDNLDSIFADSDPVKAMMSGFGVESIMVTAIQKEGENIGFIVLDNPGHKPGDFNLLDTASIFIANNIERQLFENELEKSVVNIESRIDISRFILNCADILFKNKDIPKAIDQLLEEIAVFFDADRCTLLEYTDDSHDDDEHEDYVHIRMTYEYCSDNVASLLQNFKSEYLHQDIETYIKLNNYQSVYTKLDNLNITKNSLEYNILMKNNVEAVMIVPLRKNNEATGLVLLQNPKAKINETDVLYTISGFLISELNKRDIIFELEHLSFRDKLTGLYNRNFYLRTIEMLQNKPPEKLGVIFADINGLKRVNDNLGHEYGDAFIRWCATFLKKYNGDYPVFRIGGDEFIAIVYDMEVDEFFEHIKIMRDDLYKHNLVNMSMGGTFVEEDVDINKQIVETDKIMYFEKQKYYILKKLMNVNVEAELETLKNLLSEHLE